MKQVLQNMKTGRTAVVQVPMPSPRRGQALVRVGASLVSVGTERMLVEFAGKSLVGKARARPDLIRQVIDKARREGLLTTVEAALNRLDQPMALGYSSAGTIAALGEGMDGFHVGQRAACAGGGYAVHAEYNLVPRNLLTPLPEEVDFETGAFTTLAAVALHGFRLAETQVGEQVAVIGLGLLGLLTAQIAAAAGCRVFGIDTDPDRVALAASLGLPACPRDRAEQAAPAFSLRGAQAAGMGFDAVLICADTASSDPVELAGALARDRGRVVATGAVGLTLPRKVYYEKELSFINSRSYGPGRYDRSYEEGGQDYPAGYVRWTEGRNFQAVVEMMAAGRLKVGPLITHRFPIERASEAYQVITGKKKQAFLGVLLTYPEAPEAHEAAKARITTTIHPSPAAPSVVEGSVVRMGVLGAGSFANATLLPAMKRAGFLELVGIASSGGLHAAHSARKFGFRYATSSDAQILDDPQIDVVAILTRHDSHAELVVRALAAGKHVFVEKPLAIDEAGLKKVVSALTTDYGRRTTTRGRRSVVHGLLFVGFNRRFAPLAARLADFLADRTEPLFMRYRVNAGSLPLDHWVQDPAQGGGRIIGEGCHFVDFLAFLAGAAPVSVSARGLPDLGRYREDNVTITLTFPDGSLGAIDYLANGDKAFPKERLEVFCGGRVAVLDDFRSLEIVQDGRRRRVRSALRQDKGHLAEMRALVEAIRTGRPPIPYDQLIGVTRATFAAVESLRSDGKVVEIK
jgi:predicted dehydrogenase/threonine dehydrogenase-like Zn-dependent dehydrogenase